jgi:hypothetical protein
MIYDIFNPVIQRKEYYHNGISIVNTPDKTVNNKGATMEVKLGE